jgi:hypothetical protein
MSHRGTNQDQFLDVHASVQSISTSPGMNTTVRLALAWASINLVEILATRSPLVTMRV